MNNTKPFYPHAHPAIYKRVRFITAVFAISLTSLIMVFGLMQAIPSQAQAINNALLYVTSDGSSTADTCPSTAPCTLTRAVELAEDGDEIRVASGLYVSSSVTPTLSLTNLTITIIGSFDGNWEIGPLPSILDGNNNGRVIEINGGSPLIQNFVIRHGQAVNGSGIFISSNDNPTIVNNIIHYNQASNRGAGIYLDDNSTAHIERNVIHNNTATGNGGGLAASFNANYTFIGNLVYGNSASTGGGIFSQANGAIWNNTIVVNNANSSDGGGGIFSGGIATVV